MSNIFLPCQIIIETPLLGCSVTQCQSTLSGCSRQGGLRPEAVNQHGSITKLISLRNKAQEQIVSSWIQLNHFFVIVISSLQLVIHVFNHLNLLKRYFYLWYISTEQNHVKVQHDPKSTCSKAKCYFNGFMTDISVTEWNVIKSCSIERINPIFGYSQLALFALPSFNSCIILIKTRYMKNYWHSHSALFNGV